MLDIYQPMDDNARSARLKRQRLQQDLEDLQKTMFTDLDRLEKGVSGGLRYKDHISSYQQTLNKLREIYPKAKWVLIEQCLTNLENSYTDKYREDETREVIDKMKIQIVVESLEV